MMGADRGIRSVVLSHRTVMDALRPVIEARLGCVLPADARLWMIRGDSPNPWQVEVAMDSVDFPIEGHIPVMAAEEGAHR